jgi:DNA end-binding protein Ku
MTMAARAIWKGTLDLGRSHIPVKLYSAVEDHSVHFHLLEKRTHARVKQHMVNADTGKEIPTDEIRKGFEIEPATFVILNDEDLTSVEPEPSPIIEVPDFLPLGRIGHEYYERPYYLGPDGDTKAYFALAQGRCFPPGSSSRHQERLPMSARSKWLSSSLPLLKMTFGRKNTPMNIGIES